MRGLFRDRKEAGQRLALRLGRFAGEDPVVLALPRGGVPVAFEVAQVLGAPLDVAVVRKIGAPGRPELGIGAVGEGGARHLDEGMLARLGLSEALLRPVLEAAEREVERGLRRYRGEQLPISLHGRTVILVDDGIATGGSMQAAIQVARLRGAAKIVLAVPVAGPDSLQKLAHDADEIVCVEVSQMLWAVGLAYEEFEQVPADTVRVMLEAASRHRDGDLSGVVHSKEVKVQVGEVELAGDLTAPQAPSGLVLFAHGSGSNRKSRRNRRVARFLQEAGMATLLFDLLSTEESKTDAITAEHRFDIDLLARRMIGAVDWSAKHALLGPLKKACYGASTGAAAALAAAAERPSQVLAVVSRGGRPDLARRWLSRVRVPCLLLVGERDLPVLAIHSEVMDEIPGHTRLVVVHGAGHLFEEPGAMEEVARRSTEFLRAHLRSPVEMRP